MNCPHTWFSTELRGGRRLLRARLRDLLRPAPRRGRALALAGGGAYRYSHMTLTAAHYFDPEDPYPTLPEGRELLTLGRWTDPRIPAGNGWYYLPVSDFTWYPRSQFWADYQEVLTWLTSRAVFTLY